MKTPYPLILASTSKYRQELLSKLGWEFSAVSPGVDEDQYKNLNLRPEDLSLKLSYLKANAVFLKNLEACVIGSDQVCSLGNEILGKPHTKEKALEQLMKMSGKSHELLTSVSIISPKGTRSFTNKTTLHMRELDKKTLEDYINQDKPLDCAGSYKLESFGIKLFERIEMSDHTAIIGLPLIELSQELISIGYKL